MFTEKQHGGTVEAQSFCHPSRSFKGPPDTTAPTSVSNLCLLTREQWQNSGREAHKFKLCFTGPDS